MTNFYTADNHFFHENVIVHAKRPFENAAHMNRVMIENWRERVTNKDRIFVLGDFSWKNEAGLELLEELPGNKHLIIGNHDSKRICNSPAWSSVQPYLEFSEMGKKIVMCHYAMRVWNQSHRGALMLYGHSHGTLPGTDQSLDVGVDCWDYRPVTLEEIMARMVTLPKYLHEDHHQPDTDR